MGEDPGSQWKENIPDICFLRETWQQQTKGGSARFLLRWVGNPVCLIQVDSVQFDLSGSITIVDSFVLKMHYSSLGEVRKGNQPVKLRRQQSSRG